jgi:hypothetical protein
MKIPGLGAFPDFKEGAFDKSLAIAGGLVGALMGALLWGMIGKATGRELKFVSFLIGGLAGLGVLLMGKGRGQVPAILGGVMAASGLVLGKILHSLWVLGPMGASGGAMVRFHTTVVDFIFLFVAVGVGVFIPAGDNIRGVVGKLRGRVRV